MNGLKVSADGGQFSGYASTFGNVDAGGDRVLAGAFLATLPTFQRRGLVTLNHDLSRIVGYPLAIAEDTRGLFLVGATHDTPAGQEARSIMVERQAAGLVPFGLSIGYRAIRSRPAPGGVRELVEVELYEIELTPLPMNAQATVGAAKEWPLRADRTLRAELDAIRSRWALPATNPHQRLQVEILVEQARAAGVPL